MAGSSSAEREVLIAVYGRERVERVKRRLERAGIGYEIGMIAGERPQVVFLVDRARLPQARAALRRRAHGGGSAGPFPWGPVQAVAGLILAHLLVVFLAGGHPSATDLGAAGGLIVSRAAAEPWRLVTAMFVHADPAHVLWNGVSMLVFAVPLIQLLGYLRVAAIYLLAGVGGALAVLAVAGPGTVVVGSSGAVAGLFGTWVALTIGRARHSGLPRRELFRAFGIGLLVLPALLSPTTTSGRPVSVESHLGGLAVGLVAGAVAAAFQPRAASGEEDAEEQPGATGTRPGTADR